MPRRTYSPATICLALLTALSGSTASALTPVFINEIHYDNASTDTGEAIEIAGPAGTDLSDWSLVLYNGDSSSLAPYASDVLSGVIPDLGGGFGVQLVNYPTNGIQNGSPDGIALVNAAGQVVQFLSYEGAFTAVGGPADAMSSVAIGVAETGSEAVGLSLQLSGSGSVAEDFAWSAPAGSTFGAFNSTQSFAEVGEPQLLINEVDSDTAGTDTLEFVELYDGGAGNTDLSGLVLVLYNGSNDSVYASFDLDGFSTDAQGYFVMGNTAVSGVDLVFPDNSLQNGADAVALYQGDAADFPSGLAPVLSTSLLDALVYDTGDADDAGLLPLVGAGEPQVDEDGAGNKDLDAMQRCPNGAGGGGQSSVFALFAPTPAAANVCQAPPSVTPIYTVQGNAAASPLAGTTVTVQGIVTGDFQDGAGVHGDLNGFYLQEATGDGDATTSDGIFVFDGNAPAVDVSPGDALRVTGSVTEFFGETQISASSVTLISSGNALPAATEVTLGDTLGTLLNADGKLIADLEAFEGMRVACNQTLTVTELFNLDRFGELRLAEGGRLFQFTALNSPDAAGYQTHLEDVARRNIILDDGLLIQNPDPIRYPAPGLSTANPVRMGDTVSGLTGNLRFSRGSGGSGDEAYRLMPTVEPVFVADGTRPELAPAVPGRLRVASFNVLNFFNDLDDGSGSCFPSGTSADCRGADNAGEYARQLEKLTRALAGLDADIIGLIEIENDYAEGANSSIEALVTALNAAPGGCAGGYDYVPPPDGDSRIGDDAIAVGMVYCSDRLAIAPGSSPAVLDDADLPALGLSGPIFNGEATSRAPLAATFFAAESDEYFTLVVNHFKSKGASTLQQPGSTCGVDIDPVTQPDCDQLDGQGFWNQRRTQAAAALAAWLDTKPTGTVDPDVLIIGDLNAYQQEDPLQTLAASGYSDLLAILGAGVNAYSFVFDAQAGALDHALANASMQAQVSGVTEWHINADAADALDYNLDFGRNPAIFDATLPFRASDHDPLLVGLDPGIAVDNEIVGTVRRDVIVAGAGNDRISGGPRRDILTTGAGQDSIVYESLVDGGDRITDFEVGADRIDLSGVLTRLGYSGTEALADGYVSIRARGSVAVLRLDPDGTAGAARARSFVLLPGVSVAALSNPANFIF